MWNQQVRYFQREHDIEVPNIHELFINDLCAALGSMRDERYHVVLGMDANDDVRDGTVSANLASMGIQKAVISNHKDKSVPATCACNTQRKPIDSIWTSPGLEVLQCGFLLFHEYFGFNPDHILIWVKICNQTLYGHRPQHVFRALSTKIKSNNPAKRYRYIEKVLERYEVEGISEDLFNLQQFIAS